MAERKENQQGNKSGFWLGALLGGSVSYMVASSEKARNFIQNLLSGAKDTVEQGKDKAREAKGKAEEVYEKEVKPRVEDVRDTLQNKAEDAKDKVEQKKRR